MREVIEVILGERGDRVREAMVREAIEGILDRCLG